MRRHVASIDAAALVVAGCTGSGPIFAQPSAPEPSLAAPTAPPQAVADPLPIVLPRDDGPHDRLTEWWYYTGHLEGRGLDGTQHAFGFEYVIFRAERGSFPTRGHRIWRSPTRLATASTTPSGWRSATRSTARRATLTARHVVSISS